MKQSIDPPSSATCAYVYRVVAGPEERSLARSLVDRMYSSRLQLLELEDQPEAGRQQVTVVALQGHTVVATLTLQSHAFALDEPRIPLELEALYDLEGSPHDPRQVAEVRRVASLPGHGAGVRGLYEFAAKLSAKAGICDWLGLVEARGARAHEAGLVHRVAKAHGLVDTPSLALRCCDAGVAESLLEEGAAFSLGDLRALPLPGHIASFARSLGARAVGIPTLHPAYPRLVLPMRAPLRPLSNP